MPRALASRKGSGSLSKVGVKYVKYIMCFGLDSLYFGTFSDMLRALVSGKVGGCFSMLEGFRKVCEKSGGIIIFGFVRF